MSEIFNLSREKIDFLNNNGLLKIYIEKKLICKYANKLDYSEAKEKAILDKFYKDQDLGNSEKIADYIKKKDFLDKEELKQKLLIQNKLEEYSVQTFEDASMSFFYDNKANLDKFFFSIIRVIDPDLALELYFRIDSNECDFSKIAKVYSKGFEKHMGGFIGPTTLSNLNPVLGSKLKSVSVGFLTEPFKLEKYWIILRLEKLVPAKFDNITKTQICRDLLNQSIKKETLLIFKKLVNNKNQSCT